jgi:signal transduction histidine kinase
VTPARTTRLALAVRENELQRLNEELTSTNTVLAHLNGDLENFVYAASHDLKTPILNVEGLMQVLLKKLPAECLEPKPVRDILDLIENSVERFKKTIESLLEISRLQQESDHAVTEVHLHEVARGRRWK